MRDADAHFALLAENIIRATHRRDISQLLSIARTLRSKPVPSVYTLTATRIGRAVAARKLHVIQTRNVGALFAALITIWKEAHRARKLRAGRVIHQEPDAVKLIAAFIRGVDAVAAPMDACRRVACVFVERRYETWRDIPGTNSISLRADFLLVSSDKSLLQRVIDYVDLHYTETSYARSKLQNCYTRAMST